MLAEAEKAVLEAAWAPARRAGVLGNASIEDLWEHTAGFASAVCSAFSAECSTWNGRVLDAGTGAGIPGVLLARQLPQANFTLADSSDRRLDHVRSARRALTLGERVSVLHGRLDDIARDQRHRAAYDVVVARLFAEPAEAAELLLPCVAPGGVAIISARADQVPQWEAASEVLVGPGTVTTLARETGDFVIVQVTNPPAAMYPRRPAARARQPLV